MNRGDIPSETSGERDAIRKNEPKTRIRARLALQMFATREICQTNPIFSIKPFKIMSYDEG